MFYKSLHQKINCIMHTCQSLWRLWHMCHAHYPKKRSITIDKSTRWTIHGWCFFMFWFTHLPESEVSSYPPSILPVARLARMVKAVAVEDPGFFSTRWGSLDFIWFYHIPPPPPSSTSASTSSHASSRSKWAQPDLNRELQISVGAAGPQPRAPDLSGHCRDLNRELQILVGTARPQPRAPDLSGHCRTSTASTRAQWALPDLNRKHHRAQWALPDLNGERRAAHAR